MSSRAKSFEFTGTDRFELKERLGAGGMGVVYSAYDKILKTRVALKTIRSPTSDLLLRLKNEFRAMQDVRHPNLGGLGELFEGHRVERTDDGVADAARGGRFRAIRVRFALIRVIRHQSRSSWCCRILNTESMHPFTSNRSSQHETTVITVE